jgi:hypothetical protein
MRKLEEIEEEIRQLSETDLVEFRKWYAQFDAQAWDKQFEAGVKARKLHVLAEAARRAHTEGTSTNM